MAAQWRDRSLLFAWGLVPVALALVGMLDRAHAAVQVTDDPTTFLNLLRPTGKFEEPSLGGFNFWISSIEGADDFRKNDQYRNEGDETNQATAIAADLGTVDNLSDRPFEFSIKHTTNKNFSFSLFNSNIGTSTLCWGIECPAGSIVTPTLNGQPPIKNYNGLQIQVRAQEVFEFPFLASITVDNEGVRR